MHGPMMESPLSTTSLIRYAAAFALMGRLGNALARLGVNRGDRLAGHTPTTVED